MELWILRALSLVGDGRDFRCGQERMGPSVRQVRRGLSFHRDQCGAAVYP
jgi:hypothetical protein